MHTRLIQPFLFILSPRETPLGTRRDVLIAASFLLAANILIGWMLIPVILQTLPSGVRSSPKVLTLVLLSQAAVLLLMLAFRWAVLTYIAWSLGAAAGAARNALPYAAVIIMADAVLLLRELLLGGILWMRSGAAAGFEAPRIGLNLFFDNPAPAINAILNEINVFSIWHVLVVVIGLQAFAGVTKRMAVAIVAIAWTVLISIGLAVSRLAA